MNARDRKINEGTAAYKLAVACEAEVDSYEVLLLPNNKGVTMSVTFKEPAPPAPPPIRKGSVVRLKSGGPLMTVHAIRKDGAVFCTWFAQDLSHNSSLFTRNTIEAIT